MSEKTTYRTRHGKDSPYFALSRETAQDESLSFEARGMLAYLLSKPDNWKVILADLQKNGGIGRDKARRLLNELQAAGYIKKDKQVKNADGTYSNVPYRIYETSQPPCTENQSTDKASTENPTLHNTESTEDRVTEKDFASPDGNAAGVPKIEHNETLPDGMIVIQSPHADPNTSAVIVNVGMPPPDAPQQEAKKERLRDSIFDAVAVGSFGLEDVNGDKTAGGRIGKVAAWLKKQPDVTPDKIMAFYGWYDRENANCNRPKDVGKFAEHWLKWVAAGSKTNPAKEIIEDDIEWVLPSTRPVIEYVDKTE